MVNIHTNYKKVGTIYCKAVKEKVTFNAYGWIHLSFNRSGKRRSLKDRKLRLHLFFYAKEVVKKSKVIIKRTEGVITSRGGIVRKTKYFEIAQGVKSGKKHITVILRKIEEGKLHFYSIRRTSNKIKKALEKSGLH